MTINMSDIVLIGCIFVPGERDYALNEGAHILIDRVCVLKKQINSEAGNFYPYRSRLRP